jgi:acyl carrier protein
MTREDLLQEAYSLIEEITEGAVSKDSLKEDDVILDTGLDSLGYAQLMLGLEDLSEADIDESSIDWSKIRTISQLVELFL